MKRITVNVGQLWENTYIKGRMYANTEKTSRYGRAFLEVAHQFDAGEEVDPANCAVTDYFLSDYYGKLMGNREAGLRFSKTYLKYFKKYFDSIKKMGYDPSISTMSVCMIEGEAYLSDGNRRIAILKALGKQKEVEVRIDNQKQLIKEANKLAKTCLNTSHLISGGKRVLYQPIILPCLSKYTTPQCINNYRKAMKTILDVCGSVEGKHVLDVGSCYGYYSFQFARRGAMVTAVEYNGTRVNLCNRLIKLYKMDWSNPLFACNRIEKYIKATSLKWDYTLMFSIFHHIYGKNPVESWKTLNQIAEKSEMILLTMNASSPIKIGEQSDLPSFIIENSILKSCEDHGPILPFNRHLLVFRK